MTFSDDKFLLTDRVAIITGGGTGIGRATALAFAAYGAHVVLASRKQENLEHVAQEVRALGQGRQALVVPTDVRSPEHCQALVDRALAAFGRLDILVNNAGGSRSFPSADLPLEQWHNMVRLNLEGPFLLCQATGKVMIRQRKGVIINVASSVGLRGAPARAAYGAAKAGLINLTLTLGTEWAQYGVRVNCVAVGAVKTEGFVRAMSITGVDPDSYSNSAMGRLGEPWEIAYPILFLASDASSFMTAQAIAVNGGFKWP